MANNFDNSVKMYNMKYKYKNNKRSKQYYFHYSRLVALFLQIIQVHLILLLHYFDEQIHSKPVCVINFIYHYFQIR